MKAVFNTPRAQEKLAPDAPWPSVDAKAVAQLISPCPAAAETPLVAAADLARESDISALWIKDERARMGLGSFKALGAAYVIAHSAAQKEDPPNSGTLSGMTFVTASAGNHGLSVAAGAQVFGAKSVIYIAETVPEVFADRLAQKGAEVRREGKDYAESMAAAQEAAQANGWQLLSDSSWPGYVDPPHRLMEGYLLMAAEAVAQCPEPPTHILLQAGVGGLAGAVAAYAREQWGDDPTIIVVEPSAAPALQASVAAGKAVETEGPDSVMGRLDCKEPSLIALNGLARDADIFLTLSDDLVTSKLGMMGQHGLATTASGGAGLAAVMDADARNLCKIGAGSRVLVFLSEQPE